MILEIPMVMAHAPKTIFRLSLNSNVSFFPKRTPTIPPKIIAHALTKIPIGIMPPFTIKAKVQMNFRRFYSNLFIIQLKSKNERS
jgi:hypothetical protein